MKLTADILGYLIVFISLASPQFPKKTQILTCSALSCLLGAVNVLLLNGGKISSVVVLNTIAVINIIMNIGHIIKGNEASTKEKIIFAILYFVGGVLGYRSLVDILAIAGAMFFVCHVFQTKEQPMRFFSFLNISVYVIYYALIGSTVVYSQIIAWISVVVALIKYNKKDKKEVAEEA